MQLRESGWAIGFTAFAAFMLIMIGTFEALNGLSAIFENEFYVATNNYFLKLDVTAWGCDPPDHWPRCDRGRCRVVHRSVWARIVGIVIAIASAIANFAFIPYYPAWSLTIIALNVAVIWVLTVHAIDFRDADVRNAAPWSRGRGQGAASTVRALDPDGRHVRPGRSQADRFLCESHHRSACRGLRTAGKLRNRSHMTSL